MTGHATPDRVCPMSGQRPARIKFTLGKIACPKCGRSVYLTMKGKLYKHIEKATRS